MGFGFSHCNPRCYVTGLTGVGVAKAWQRSDLAEVAVVEVAVATENLTGFHDLRKLVQVRVNLASDQGFLAEAR